MYVPTPVPVKAESLPNYLATELQALAQSLQGSVPFLMLQTFNAAPLKPRDGMIVRADGTHWNPGSGSGFYGYRDAAWHLLG
jgi:hypothetical protein